ALRVARGARPPDRVVSHHVPLAQNHRDPPPGGVLDEVADDRDLLRLLSRDPTPELAVHDVALDHRHPVIERGRRVIIRLERLRVDADAGIEARLRVHDVADDDRTGTPRDDPVTTVLTAGRPVVRLEVTPPQDILHPVADDAVVVVLAARRRGDPVLEPVDRVALHEDIVTLDGHPVRAATRVPRDHHVRV